MSNEELLRLLINKDPKFHTEYAKLSDARMNEFNDYQNSPEAIKIKTDEQTKRKVANFKTSPNPSQGSVQQVHEVSNVAGPIANEKPLEIVSLISGNKVRIFGHIASLSNSWASEWNTKKYYGRIDPVPTYGGTSRTLSLSIDVIRPQEKIIMQKSNNNPGIAEAKDQYDAINILTNFIYPAYDFNFNGSKTYNTGILKASPLLAIKYAGIIGGNVSTPNWGGGYLKAYATSFSFTFDASSLWDLGVSTNSQDSIIYYKKATLTFEFGILHDHNLGHDKFGNPLVNRITKDGLSDPTSYKYPLQTYGGKK